MKTDRLNKALFSNRLDVGTVYIRVGEPRVLILAQEYIDDDVHHSTWPPRNWKNSFEKKVSRLFIEAGQVRRASRNGTLLCYPGAISVL